MTAITEDAMPDVEAKPDLDVILPVNGVITVAGMPATVRRLKSREFLSLIRVLTTGLGTGIGEFKFDFDDQEQMQSDLIGLFLVAIPNAIDEFGQFLLTVVDAQDPQDAPSVRAEMQNPDPEVLIDVFYVMAEQEKDDLYALVGKARAALAKIQSLYSKTKTKQPSSSTGSSDRSRARST